MSRLGAVTFDRLDPGPADDGEEGIYPALCVFALVFLCALPLTAVPVEALPLRLAGFAVAGVAAGRISGNGGAALLGLGAGHLLVLLYPDYRPQPISTHAYAAAAVTALWAGMGIRRILSRRAPQPATPAAEAVLPVAGIAAGLLPFAFSRPGVTDHDGAVAAAVLLGFSALLLLGALSPGRPRSALGWFALGHTPFLLLGFMMFVLPAVIDIGLAYGCIWIGSGLAEGAGAAVPRVPPTGGTRALAASRDPGRRMG